MSSSVLLFSVLAVAVAVAAAAAQASNNVTSDEEYWAERAEVAHSRNRAAYVSDPVAAMNRFNADVLRYSRCKTTALVMQ